jgi:hypothetical protein
MLDKDSLGALIILVESKYTVLQKRKHRQLEDSERLTTREVAVLVEGPYAGVRAALDRSRRTAAGRCQKSQPQASRVAWSEDQES